MYPLASALQPRNQLSILHRRFLFAYCLVLLIWRPGFADRVVFETTRHCHTVCSTMRINISFPLTMTIVVLLLQEGWLMLIVE
ncbi:hypothetical protein BDV09DRAFT_162848 [Aspergillus tetrazonus]